MRSFKTRPITATMALIGTVSLLGLYSAMAREITFSIDWQGPAAAGPGPGFGIPDSFFGFPLDEGQILTPGLPGPPGPNPEFPGPLPPPGIMIDSAPGSPVGTVPGGLGILPSPLMGVEVDALSYGRDRGRRLVFSVDEFASGDVTIAPVFPDVQSEGAVGFAEASADQFRYLGPVAVTPFVAPIPGFGPGNTAISDGDGLFPWGGPGVGLIEPNPPTPGALLDPGDNLDALDADTGLADPFGPIYFSLDSRFADPLEVFPANTGTAGANGFVSGDVLITFAGGAPGVFIPAGVLGLDLIAGPDSDDLDGLALYENGDGLFGPNDVIYFSVRRGSAVIGAPDSLNGMPIEEGDILTLPIPGGVSPFPSIFIPAEALGLGTFRSGSAGAFAPFGDELDALDLPGCRLPGCDGPGADVDFDGDCDVDSVDLAILLSNFGAAGPFVTNTIGDADGDMDVDSTDLAALLSSFGLSCY